MMKIIKKHIFFILTLLFSGYLNAATITWDSTANNVNENDIFSLDVVGLGFVSNVDGGGVNLSFDPSVLSVLSVSIDDLVWDLGVGNSTGTIDNVGGTVNGIAVNAWSAVTGDFTVATIEFQVIGSIGFGSSLALSEYALNPWASGGSAINPIIANGSVSVVPVPAAVWLFGSGLLALTSLARRKHKV